jgi:hypothetical protein
MKKATYLESEKGKRIERKEQLKQAREAWTKEDKKQFESESEIHKRKFNNLFDAFYLCDDCFEPKIMA